MTKMRTKWTGWDINAPISHSKLLLLAGLRLPQRDGQAELTWVTGYTPRWFTRAQTVTHPSTNPVGVELADCQMAVYLSV